MHFDKTVAACAFAAVALCAYGRGMSGSPRHDVSPVAGEETAVWQRKIDAAASAGGGIVSVPAGVHRVGQLVLRSNVELHLEEGAVLLGLCGIERYGRMELPYSEGTWSAVVFAFGETNVSVSGKGEIDGGGKSWPYEIPCPKGICKEGLRARGLFFGDCRNVRLEDFTLRDSACWGIVFKRCDGVLARRVVIDNHAHRNNDGFDIEAKNVSIIDCDVDSGDDAICVKSNDPFFTVENVLVSNCTARSHCNGLKLGTASHGTMRNIRFVGCRTGNPLRNFIVRDGEHAGRQAYWWRCSWEFPLGIGNGAINVENVDGGTVEDVVFDGIEAYGFSVPIFVRGGRRTRRTCGIPPSDRLVMRNITLRNIRGEACSAHASSITGVDACRPRNVRLENVHITCRGSGSGECSEPDSSYDGRYPDASMFDRIRLPAYGLYIDRADGVELVDVSFSLRKGDSDGRPAVYESRRRAPDGKVP